MEQYISKSALVAEIEKELNTTKKYSTEYVNGKKYALKKILSFLDTLEMKEIHEDIDMDLNPFFEELGVEPDSRIASMFKESFYKGIDRYLNKKEDKS
jgi:hypothetical protein